MRVETLIAPDHRRDLSRQLSHLLADTYTLYLKTQNFHWNVTGPLFGSLHALFESQYNALAEAVDTIAERIRALGYPAPASFAQFSELSSIKEETSVPKAEEMIRQLVLDHEAVIKTARSIYALTETAHDEVTADLLTDRLTEHEKTAWMLRSYLE